MKIFSYLNINLVNENLVNNNKIKVNDFFEYIFQENNKEKNK